MLDAAQLGWDDSRLVPGVKSGMTQNQKTLADIVKEARGSRTIAAFASLAGVSNRTIIRIERGNFPESPRPSDAPKLRAAIGVVTRLAIAAGADPVDWLKVAELPCEKSDVDTARQRFRRRQVADAKLPYGAIQIIKQNRGKVLAALFNFGPFVKGERKNEFHTSFICRYFSMLCSAIDPSWEPEFEPFESLAEIKRRWDDAPDSFQVVLGGVVQIPGRRILDLDFVPIPGWSIPLTAMQVSGEEVSWSDIVRGTSSTDHVAIFAAVISGAAGEFFIRGRCHYPPDRIGLLKDMVDMAALVEWLAEKAANNPQHAVVFVADQLVVRAAYQAQAEQGHTWRLVAPDPFAPTYPLSLAVRRSDLEWRDLIKDVQQIDLFKASATVTAQLYADHITRSTIDEIESHWANLSHIRLTPLPYPAPLFQQRLCALLHDSFNRNSSKLRKVIPDEWLMPTTKDLMQLLHEIATKLKIDAARMGFSADGFLTPERLFDNEGKNNDD